MNDTRFEAFGRSGTTAMGAARNEFATLPETALPAMPRVTDPAMIPQALPKHPAQPQQMAASAPVAAPLPSAQSLSGPRMIFAADAAVGADLLDHGALVRPIAELLAHAGTQTPVTIGLMGAPGSGKSHALALLLESVEAIAAAAAKTAGSPFVAPVLAVQIDAATLRGEAGGAIADRVFAHLSQPGAQDYSHLAEMAADMAGDPRDMAHEAAEKLDAARRGLDSEQRGLADLVARRAKLADTVLHEQAGSPIDAFFRSRRASIEGRLRAFGFNSGDVAAIYKDLVRDLAESGGSRPGLTVFLRATWAYAGQTKLIVWALVFLCAAFGMGALQASKAAWLDMLLNAGPNFAPFAGWLAQHESWLGFARQGFLIASGLAIARNIWRALRFTQPLAKGVALLRQDVASRAGDMDALIAHQARRVETLGSEISRHQRSASVAQKRAQDSGASGRGPVRSLITGAPANAKADGFLAALASLLAQTPDAAQTQPSPAPRRILVAIDNLDAVAPARAFEIMDAAAHVLSGRCFASVLVLDPKTLGAGRPDEMARLEKYVHVPVQIGRNGVSAGQGATIVLSLLGHAAPQKSPPVIDASRSMLDRPITVAEAKLLGELAPLAGRSARALKRFVNLFRLARAAHPESGAAIAFVLALDIGGTPAEITALRHALGVMDGNATFNVADGGARIHAALQAVRMNSGQAVTGAVMLAGLNAASPYMRR